LMFIKYEDLICVSTVWMTQDMFRSRKHKMSHVTEPITSIELFHIDK
jgi:hypothetical protein